jgi:hypothetical protein
MNPENGQFDNPIANLEARRVMRSYQRGESRPGPSNFYNQDAPEGVSNTEHTDVYTREVDQKPANDVFVANRHTSGERPSDKNLSDNERRHIDRKKAAKNPNSPRGIVRRVKDKLTKVADHTALLGSHAAGLHKEESHPNCVECTDPGWDTRAWDSVVFK